MTQQTEVRPMPETPRDIITRSEDGKRIGSVIMGSNTSTEGEGGELFVMPCQATNGAPCLNVAHLHENTYLSRAQAGRLATFLYRFCAQGNLDPPEFKKPSGPVDLTFEALREASFRRLPDFNHHPLDDGSDWNPAQWLQALVGEVGEYANFRKKFERGDMSLDDFEAKAKRELADVACYLVFLAARCLDTPGRPHPTGIDLGRAIVEKFNEVSVRIGSEVFLTPPARDNSALLARIAESSIHPTDWEAWKAELNRIAGDSCGPGNLTDQTGEDCWRDSFEAGQTPAQAMEEEMTYWHD